MVEKLFFYERQLAVSLENKNFRKYRLKISLILTYLKNIRLVNEHDY